MSTGSPARGGRWTASSSDVVLTPTLNPKPNPNLTPNPNPIPNPIPNPNPNPDPDPNPNPDPDRNQVGTSSCLRQTSSVRVLG